MLYEIRLALFDFCRQKGVSTRSWLILKLLFWRNSAFQTFGRMTENYESKKQIACQKVDTRLSEVSKPLHLGGTTALIMVEIFEDISQIVSLSPSY